MNFYLMMKDVKNEQPLQGQIMQSIESYVKADVHEDDDNYSELDESTEQLTLFQIKMLNLVSLVLQDLRKTRAEIEQEYNVKLNDNNFDLYPIVYQVFRVLQETDPIGDINDVNYTSLSYRFLQVFMQIFIRSTIIGDENILTMKKWFMV